MMFEIHVMGEIIAISISDVISLVAGLIAVVAVVYARRSAKEAERANNMGRLNALLSFRAHYLELMQHQEKMADVLRHSSSGMEAVSARYADLDLKLRQVATELERYHVKVVMDEI
ncbi:hypothetical protein [Aeromonas salmonicida]|uniref:hypothetical protein n=1 Tax=Aeromonas salmonicida TaxID=645 RepID=UPI00259DA126|nr:hypothetical protein [Aeromonas salmonicida]MDM5103733.1 hypothetical protein [Aeromonas salmonicida]